MSAEIIARLERRLDRERRAREVLEKEIEAQVRKLYVSAEYHQKVFDVVGVHILHLSHEGLFIKANKYALSELFEEKIPTDVLSSFRLNNSPIKSEDIPALVDQELEITFIHPSGKRHIMVARITKLHHEQPDSELLLTMKDFQDIREKDHEIKELQNQLVDSAYRDGVAENAVSVLHNIGNILTTIIGKMSNERMLHDLALLTSVLGKLSTTFNGFHSPEEFGEFIAKDPKAKAIPKLIQELAKSVSGTEQSIQETFSSVKGKCIDIAEVITAQQNYANFKDKTKSEISARKIVSDCLVMHKERIAQRSIDVIIGDFPIAAIYMEKIGFAQTLSNAIMNAIEAIDERFMKDPSYVSKKIQVSAIQQGSFLVIEIVDNGIGINPEALSKLFKFGFSTKNRSSGFGLHNCANFMNSNGGKIEIKSPGENLGASTVLHCPTKNQEV